MSKFVEKLSKASRSDTTPIGFHSPTSKTSSSSLLLIAAISSTDTVEVKSLAASPIDAALILDPKVTIAKTKQFIKLLGDIPLGLVINQLNTNDVAINSIVGLDFIAFDRKTPITSTQITNTGRLFIIDSALNMDLVKAINSLDIDGVLIDNSKVDSLTIEHILICKRFSELLHKPLLMIVSSMITDYELHQLWETEIAGIVFPVTWLPESLERLKHAIDNLSKIHTHRIDKLEAILPHYTETESSDEDDE